MNFYLKKMRKVPFSDTLRKGENICNLENLQTEEQMFHGKIRHFIYLFFRRQRSVHSVSDVS